MTTNDRNDFMLKWGERAQDVTAIMSGVRKTMLEGGFDEHVADHLAPSVVFSSVPPERSEPPRNVMSAVQLPDGRTIMIPAGSTLRIDAELNLTLELASDD